MLDFLKSLLGLNSVSRWDYYTLFNKLKVYKKAKLLFPEFELPEQIFLTSSFWKEMKNMFDLTLKDEHEREISVYWIDNDLVFTKYIRGEKSSVTSRHSISVKYLPRSNGYYDKIVTANGNVVFKSAIYKSRLPKKVEIFRMFSLHTHPPHYNVTVEGQQERYYNFFSGTDINSLVVSNDLVAGLITDKIYLIFKTNRLSISGVERKEYITPSKLYDWGITLYEGDFAVKKFNKVNIIPE